MTRSPFDESARRIVQSVRTMVDHRVEYRTVNAAEFPGRDAEFLDGTARELAAEGWQTLGDFEDAAFNRGRQNKNFVRMALSGDRTAYAMWFSAPAAPRPARVLGLRSLLGDGRVLLTLRGGSKTDLPTPPAYLVERLDEGASTGQQVRRHRERVDAPPTPLPGRTRAWRNSPPSRPRRRCSRNSAPHGGSLCSSRCCEPSWGRTSTSAVNRCSIRSWRIPSGGPQRPGARRDSTPTS